MAPLRKYDNIAVSPWTDPFASSPKSYKQSAVGTVSGRGFSYSRRIVRLPDPEPDPGLEPASEHVEEPGEEATGEPESILESGSEREDVQVKLLGDTASDQAPDKPHDPGQDAKALEGRCTTVSETVHDVHSSQSEAAAADSTDNVRSAACCPADDSSCEPPPEVDNDSERNGLGLLATDNTSANAAEGVSKPATADIDNPARDSGCAEAALEESTSGDDAKLKTIGDDVPKVTLVHAPDAKPDDSWADKGTSTPSEHTVVKTDESSSSIDKIRFAPGTSAAKPSRGKKKLTKAAGKNAQAKGKSKQKTKGKEHDGKTITPPSAADISAANASEEVPFQNDASQASTSPGFPSGEESAPAAPEGSASSEIPSDTVSVSLIDRHPAQAHGDDSAPNETVSSCMVGDAGDALTADINPQSEKVEPAGSEAAIEQTEGNESVTAADPGSAHKDNDIDITAAGNQNPPSCEDVAAGEEGKTPMSDKLDTEPTTAADPPHESDHEERHEDACLNKQMTDDASGFKEKAKSEIGVREEHVLAGNQLLEASTDDPAPPTGDDKCAPDAQQTMESDVQTENQSSSDTTGPTGDSATAVESAQDEKTAAEVTLNTGDICPVADLESVEESDRDEESAPAQEFALGDPASGDFASSSAPCESTLAAQVSPDNVGEKPASVGEAKPAEEYGAMEEQQPDGKPASAETASCDESLLPAQELAISDDGNSAKEALSDRESVGLEAAEPAENVSRTEANDTCEVTASTAADVTSTGDSEPVQRTQPSEESSSAKNITDAQDTPPAETSQLVEECPAVDCNVTSEKSKFAKVSALDDRPVTIGGPMVNEDSRTGPEIQPSSPETVPSSPISEKRRRPTSSRSSKDTHKVDSWTRPARRRRESDSSNGKEKAARKGVVDLKRQDEEREKRRAARKAAQPAEESQRVKEDEERQKRHEERRNARRIVEDARLKEDEREHSGKRAGSRRSRTSETSQAHQQSAAAPKKRPPERRDSSPRRRPTLFKTLTGAGLTGLSVSKAGLLGRTSDSRDRYKQPVHSAGESVGKHDSAISSRRDRHREEIIEETTHDNDERLYRKRTERTMIRDRVDTQTPNAASMAATTDSRQPSTYPAEKPVSRNAPGSFSSMPSSGSVSMKERRRHHRSHRSKDLDAAEPRDENRESRSRREKDSDTERRRDRRRHPQARDAHHDGRANGERTQGNRILGGLIRMLTT